MSRRWTTPSNRSTLACSLISSPRDLLVRQLAAHRHAKSKPIRGQFPVIVAAIRGSTSEGIHVPSTPAQATPRLPLLALNPGAAVVRRAHVVIVPDVRAPLPNVPEHVVHAPRIRPLQTDRP